MGVKPISWRIRRHKDNPCKPDCQRRSATCHAECPEYAKFFEIQKTEAEKRHIQVLSKPPFKPIK